MARRLALVFLASASPLLLVLFAVGGRVSEVLFVVLVMAFPVALMAVGAARRGGLGPLTVPLGALLVILEACGIAMLLLRGRVEDGPWVGGLPAAAAVQLYGLFVAPLLLVVLAYALTFESTGIDDDDLRRLEELARPRGEDH